MTFNPLVGGHLTPKKGHITIPKRSLWISWQTCANPAMNIRQSQVKASWMWIFKGNFSKGKNPWGFCFSILWRRFFTLSGVWVFLVWNSNGSTYKKIIWSGLGNKFWASSKSLTWMLFPYYSLPFGGFPQPAVNGRWLNLLMKLLNNSSKKKLPFFCGACWGFKIEAGDFRQKKTSQILPFSNSMNASWGFWVSTEFWTPT